MNSEHLSWHPHFLPRSLKCAYRTGKSPAGLGADSVPIQYLLQASVGPHGTSSISGLRAVAASGTRGPALPKVTAFCPLGWPPLCALYAPHGASCLADLSLGLAVLSPEPWSSSSPVTVQCPAPAPPPLWFPQPLLVPPPAALTRLPREGVQTALSLTAVPRPIFLGLIRILSGGRDCRSCSFRILHAMVREMVP